MDWQIFAGIGALLTIVITVITYFTKVVHWVGNNDKTKAELDALSRKHDADISAIKDELCINTYAILACLKGLQEQGCNGEVSKAINLVEKHLNEQAHK